MARSGITYAQVCQVAETLISEGRRPMIRLVRERLGDTGSPNTIHKHLARWREENPSEPSEQSAISVALVRAIGAEIERAVCDATSSNRLRLEEVQAEAASLAAVGQSLENECEALGLQVARLTSDRDRLKGAIDEQVERIAKQEQEIEREREISLQLRTDLAVARDRLERATERIAAQEQDIERLTQNFTMSEVARSASKQ